MDAISAHLDPEGGLMLVAGQANRGQQMQLRKNIRDGCYNQLTDEREPPWPGASTMLLYELAQRPWESVGAGNGEGRGGEVEGEEEGEEEGEVEGEEEGEEEGEGGVSGAASGTEASTLIPIAAIVYAAAGEAQLEQLIGPEDHVATQQDEEDQMITF